MCFSDLITISLTARFPEGSSDTGALLVFCVLAVFSLAASIAWALKTGKAGYTSHPTAEQSHSRSFPDSHLVTRKHDPLLFWARIGIATVLMIILAVMTAFVLAEDG